jgi:hypothetical protein
MKNTLLFILALIIVFSIILGTPPVYTYDAPANAGIVVFGMYGYETRGTPGPFMCTAQYNRYTQTGYSNPLAFLFPSLIVDC